MLLVDFSAIKSGGGAQLALNFLKFIERNEKLQSCKILVSNKFPYINKLNVKADQLIVAPSSIFKRVFFEYYELPKIVSGNGIKDIFTFFGPGLPKLKNVRTVTSLAYPIICYDESPYWRFVPKSLFVKKKLINHFRKKRLAQQDLLIAETNVMKSRLCKVLKVEQKKIRILQPTPTTFIKEKPFNLHNMSNRVLVLSGLDPHKNIWRIPEVIKMLKSDVNFLMSIKEQDFVQHCLEYTGYKPSSSVLSRIEFKGNIPADEIEDLYLDSFALVNLSDLESFSNNYMEAWVAGVPIIASDRDFAREICRGSALYAEPHEPAQVASTIDKLFLDIKVRAELVSNGKKQLSTLPTLQQRCAFILELLDDLKKGAQY